MIGKIAKTVLIFAIVTIGHASIVSAQSIVPERLTPDQANMEASYIGVVQQLPSGSWTAILAGIVQFVLAITGSLALVSFTYGGITMITAMGKDDQITKGKGILMWSVLALIIIAVSYAIVLGITQLVFV